MGIPRLEGATLFHGKMGLLRDFLRSSRLANRRVGSHAKETLRDFFGAISHNNLTPLRSNKTRPQEIRCPLFPRNGRRRRKEKSAEKKRGLSRKDRPRGRSIKKLPSQVRKTRPRKTGIEAEFFFLLFRPEKWMLDYNRVLAKDRCCDL